MVNALKGIMGIETNQETILVKVLNINLLQYKKIEDYHALVFQECRLPSVDL